MMQEEPKLNQVFPPEFIWNFELVFSEFIVIDDFTAFICGMIRTFHIGVILEGLIKLWLL